MKYYCCKYNKISQKNLPKVSHISFDMKNDDLKQAYGFALDEDLKTLGRVVAEGNDEEYTKLCEFMDRGVNMFNASNGIVVIR